MVASVVTIPAFVSAQTPTPVTPPARPIPAVEHVFIISLDGLRPDKLLQADAPNLHALLKEGTYTMWARTTALAITLPSHTSMVTGVTPEKHGITWNDDSRLDTFPPASYPTIMQLAHDAGYGSAMVAGKLKFSTLNRRDPQNPDPAKRETIDYVWLPPRTTTATLGSAYAKVDNDTVVREAVQIIEAHKPALMFIHFPDTDTVGHDQGWASDAFLAAVKKTDGQIGTILAAMTHADIRSSSVIIVTADHGGQGKSHGAGDERSLNIPWIITGPGVRHGYDLTDNVPLVVHTEDTAATAAWLLGLKQPDYFDGKVVQAAFDKK